MTDKEIETLHDILKNISPTSELRFSNFKIDNKDENYIFVGFEIYDSPIYSYIKRDLELMEAIQQVISLVSEHCDTIIKTCEDIQNNFGDYVFNQIGD